MEQQPLRGTRICHSLHPAITIITTVTPIITIDALKCGSTTKNAIIIPKGMEYLDMLSFQDSKINLFITHVNTLCDIPHSTYASYEQFMIYADKFNS